MILEIKNLCKNYGTNSVLEDINFEFVSGKIYGLIGKNGAGKTTFFNCLNGSVSKDAGKANLITNEGTKTSLTSEHVGFIESTPVLPEFLTGKEFVQFLLDIQEKNTYESLEKLFDIVSLDVRDQEKLIKTYSHGMKNKIQMLSLLICDAPVLFLDEPLTSLDVVVASDIKKIIRQMKENHIIIFSTHILQLAKDLCDEIIILNEKKITLVDKKMLYDENFEEKIIELLKDDEEDA